MARSAVRRSRSPVGAAREDGELTLGLLAFLLLLARLFPLYLHADAMVLVLVICCGVSLGIQSWIEGGVIAAVIAINVGVGFYQELGAVRSLSLPHA